MKLLPNNTEDILRQNKYILNTAYYIGYDPDKIAYIRSKLNELSPTQFTKAFEQEQTLKDLQLRYNLTKEDIDPEILNKDISPLIDNVYENIDKIVEAYK